jgi:hypothetical protein
MYKEFKKLNPPKFNDPMKKWAKEVNRIFHRKKTKWPKHMKKCSPSLAIKGCKSKHIKILPHSCSNSYHEEYSNKSWQGCGEKGTLIHC